MTNPIPAWSQNLAINMPKAERALLGRLAARFGAPSVGRFVKELIALGLERKCALSAEQLKQIRRQYYGGVLVLLFLAGMLASWCGREDLERQCRRCTRRPGCRFEECVTVEMEEV